MNTASENLTVQPFSNGVETFVLCGQLCLPPFRKVHTFLHFLAAVVLPSMVALTTMTHYREQ